MAARRGRPWSWRAFGPALCLLCLIAAPAGAAPTEPLRAEGRWFLDADGRAVVFHGVNIVPPGPGMTPAEAGVGADDLRFLHDEGFRLVRFGQFYADVEPRPGRYDVARLAAIRDYQRLIAEAGMFTVFDYHQDLFAARYKGRGFPGWMALDHGVPNFPNPGFAAGYFVNPAANRAYDSFWADAPAADGIGVQTHFARGWRRTAAALGGDRAPKLLGYDILNEPWPGTAWPTCANPEGCPPGGFDQTRLTAFTRRMIDSIRRADARRVVFFEPNLQFDVGADTGLRRPQDANKAFSFHDYCLGAAPGLPAAPDPLGLCAIGETRVIDLARAYGRRVGATPILTEFGDTHDPAIQRRVVTIADRSMLSWTAWAYWAAAGQILEDPARPPRPGNLDQGVLDAIVRPYPHVVAGTPWGWRWDPGAGVFSLSYSTYLPRGGGPAPRGLETEVIVPKRAFPHGYRAQAAGGRVVSEAGAAVLRLLADPGAGRVRVEVRALPAPG